MMENEETITTNPSYDVFISFYGFDTRLSFTGNLFNALLRKRFKTFIDNNGIKSGDQIVASTFKALEGSKISIVVFSKRYAASTYCLDELFKILECRNKINQRVLPIFYEVDPFEVRDQTGTYGKSLDAHEYRFGKDYVKLQNWKSALSEVAVLTGWHFQNRYTLSIFYFTKSNLHDQCIQIKFIYTNLIFMQCEKTFTLSAHIESSV